MDTHLQMSKNALELQWLEISWSCTQIWQENFSFFCELRKHGSSFLKQLESVATKKLETKGCRHPTFSRRLTGIKKVMFVIFILPPLWPCFPYHLDKTLLFLEYLWIQYLYLLKTLNKWWAEASSIGQVLWLAFWHINAPFCLENFLISTIIYKRKKKFWWVKEKKKVFLRINSKK